MTQRDRDGRKNTQARVTESGNGKLDHQFFFSIYFDLRDCTVSVSRDLGHLEEEREQNGVSQDQTEINT